MRRLLLKIAFFLLPFALLAPFPAWVCAAAGEWIDIDRFAARIYNADHPVLLGLAYTDPKAYFKLKVVNHAGPEIVSLGTSRVMQFRKDFFQRSFYNAGGMRRLTDFRKFLDRVKPEKQPKCLIVGADQNFFDESWDLAPLEVFNPPAAPWRILFESWDKVYWDWFQGKFRTADLLKTSSDGVERIGLSAITRDSGFRGDGSYQWLWREADEDDLREIAENKHVYKRGGIAADRLVEWDAFLAECKRRGILVAGFLPPFSPRTFRALEKEKSEFAYIFELRSRIQPLFEKYDFPFQDFTNPVPLRLNKLGFVDGEHASEAAYRRLWKLWQEREPRLRDF